MELILQFIAGCGVLYATIWCGQNSISATTSTEYNRWQIAAGIVLVFGSVAIIATAQ